jgi:hypothetical protein
MQFVEIRGLSKSSPEFHKEKENPKLDISSMIEAKVDKLFKSKIAELLGT